MKETETAILEGFRRRAFLLDDPKVGELRPERLPRPASAAVLLDAERALGHPLHSLHAAILREIADGGIGPGIGGLIGVSLSGQGDEEGRRLVEFTEFLRMAFPSLPSPTVGICEWGGSIWTAVAGSVGDSHILTLWDGGVVETDLTLPEFLQRWLDGRDLLNEMFEWREKQLASFVTRYPVQAIGKYIGG